MNERDPISKTRVNSAPTPSIRLPDGRALAAVLGNDRSISLVPLTPEQLNQHLQNLREQSIDYNRLEATEAETERGRLKSAIKNAEPSLRPFQGK